MSRSKIGDRVIFTEYACESVNISSVYKDVYCKDIIGESSGPYCVEVTKNMSELKGIIINKSEKSYTALIILFEYKNEHFFTYVDKAFLTRDKEYYRDKKINSLLDV